MIAAFWALCVSVSAQPRLTFGEDGRFKIVQFTDTHIDLGIDSLNTVFTLISETIAAEKPDLVVFTGDVVLQNPLRGGWLALVSLMDESGVPWTVTFGNHDREYGMTNAEIFELIRVSRSLIMESGPDEVAGTGNFAIELAEKGCGRPSNVLYFFDSHSMARQQHDAIAGYGWIEDSQIAWYRTASARWGVPALAFFHIPLPEYREVDAAKKMIGVWNEKVCSPAINTGLFATMLLCGDVRGMFVGHDHVNCFVADHLGIALAYGRFSGSNAATYGDLEPGARVITVRAGEERFETYVRLRSGLIIDRCTFPDSFRD